MAGIVVGIDGSEGSKGALRWAAAEARLRKAPLRLVWAWQVPPFAYGMGSAGVGLAPVGIAPDTVGDLRAVAERGLGAVVEECADDLAGLEVEQAVVQDAPAGALLAAARDADLLVVGTRGHGGFTGLLLGSVSQQTAQHSPCPVVIVPTSVDDL